MTLDALDAAKTRFDTFLVSVEDISLRPQTTIRFARSLV